MFTDLINIFKSKDKTSNPTDNLFILEEQTSIKIIELC
jgi:hypothetical protein